jgi:hypothetical protein
MIFSRMHRNLFTVKAADMLELVGDKAWNQ